MDLTNQINIEEIINIYLLANTPMFLYRNMKGVYSLKNLVSNNDLGVLINEYTERTIKKERKPEDIAISYAILIAITSMDYKEAAEAFDKFDLSKLEWGSDIRDIFITKAIILANIELSVPPTVIDTQQVIFSSTASISYLNVDNKDTKRNVT